MPPSVERVAKGRGESDPSTFILRSDVPEACAGSEFGKGNGNSSKLVSMLRLPRPSIAECVVLTAWPRVSSTGIVAVVAWASFR